MSRKIILASASPRRRQLLEGAGFLITVRPSDADETWPDALPEVAVLEVARRKLLHVGTELPVLAADTVVVLRDSILGKPRDVAEAFAMLRQLSGQTHRVI